MCEPLVTKAGSSSLSGLRPKLYYLQHNKRREELHRLKEKHPEVAARLALKVRRFEKTSYRLQLPAVVQGLLL